MNAYASVLGINSFQPWSVPRNRKSMRSGTTVWVCCTFRCEADCLLTAGKCSLSSSFRRPISASGERRWDIHTTLLNKALPGTWEGSLAPSGHSNPRRSGKSASC